ncbi:MAG TPA: tetratricopeptide repeat protein [Bacteroidales bacterium]|nr:tetratricopeptide repeat protein [Bacteroidales bacterium]
MVKKQDQTEERIVAVESALTRTEHFIEENQRMLLIIIGAIALVVLGYFAFQRYYLAPREQEAAAQMFMAEKYFEKDSLALALNGDGNYPGFLAIIDDYGMTRAGNLAHYYAGICYLRQGQFEDALDHLKSFDKDDLLVSAMAVNAIGDCHMELNDPEKAAGEYIKAADMNPNDLTSPAFLLKAGWAYEVAGDWASAVKMYERIRVEFPKSQESRDIEKYIARANGKMAS